MFSATAPTLRPLSVGEILDHAIRLYRRHFITFIGIIALVQIPYVIFQTIITGITSSQMTQIATQRTATIDYGTMFGAQLLTYLLIVVQLVLVEGIGMAALARAVADSYLGQPVSILEAYQRMGRSWIGLVGALLLVGLIAIGFAIWMLIPCVGWFTGVGVLLFLGLAVRPLVTIVYVVEKIGAVASFRRAWDLAKRRFWWLIGFTMLLTLFAFLVISGPTALLQLLLQKAFSVDIASPYANPQVWGINLVIMAIISLIGSLIYLPLQLTANTLVYFDLRVRTEGFDLSMLAANAGADQAEAARSAPTVPNEPFLTLRDAGNFFALSFVGIILWGGLAVMIGVLSQMIVGGGQ